VNRNGCVQYMGKVVFISESLIGHEIAVRQTQRGRLVVRFYDLDLGLFDLAAAPPHHAPRLIPLLQLPKRKRATSP